MLNGDHDAWDRGQEHTKINVMLKIEIITGVYCTPNLKLACFMCYLKIINTFSKNNARTASKSRPKWSKKFKNGIEISWQVVFKLWNAKQTK